MHQMDDAMWARLEAAEQALADVLAALPGEV